MEIYPWLVVIHLIGAFAFVAGHGVSMHTSIRLRSERDPARVAALLDLSGASLGLVYIGLLLLLGGGIAAGFVGGHWGRLWIWVSLILLIGVAVFMYVVATPYYASLRRAVGQRAQGDKDDAPPPEPLPTNELAALLVSSRPLLLAVVGGVVLVVIIGLMYLKPF